MKYLSRKSVAEFFDVSPQTVDRMVRRGILPRPKRIGNLRRWDVDDLKAIPEEAPRPKTRFGLSSDPDEALRRMKDEIRGKAGAA